MFCGFYGVGCANGHVLLPVKRMGVYERCMYVYVRVSVSEPNPLKSQGK